ncbi:MAG: hypothetical protein ACI4IW_05690 [Oscillospiraceae bacterium]
MSFYEILWYFFIYAFLGWCTEVAFFAVKTGKFVNRGFLNGPVCPIYGFGLVIVILLLTPLSKSLLLLFAGSMVLTSTLEFMTGWALEKIFHTRWWDYSNQRFNLKGYICLEFSLIWGFAATFVMKIVQPIISTVVGKIPTPVGVAFLCAFSLIIVFDLVATVLSINNMQKNLKLISAMAEEVRSFSDKIGEGISDKTLVVKEGAEDVLDRYSDLAAMRKEHKAEEQALSEKHRAEEQALLELILSKEKERISENMEAKSEEQHMKLESLKAGLSDKLAAAKRRYGRVLKAFPDLKSRDYQDIIEKLKKK